MSAGLETQGLCKSFGALAVASAIDFRLERGARHALIGPNGAGKTSFVNLVTGALRPGAGRILLGGEDVTSLPQAARVKRGLVRTFQINALFRRLSVLENVTLAIAERDIGKVFDEQECVVRAEAFPERTYPGWVTRRMPTGDRSKGAVPVRVQIKIPRAEEGQYLRPEMGAVVTFFSKKMDPEKK